MQARALLPEFRPVSYTLGKYIGTVIYSLVSCLDILIPRTGKGKAILEIVTSGSYLVSQALSTSNTPQPESRQIVSPGLSRVSRAFART